MTLFIQANASYLSRPKARSVAGGICYLSNKDSPNYINGAIHAVSSVIPSVVASAAAAEYAALFILGQEGEYLRQVLANMGYQQAPTLILCDNQCAVGMATNTVDSRSRAPRSLSRTVAPRREQSCGLLYKSAPTENAPGSLPLLVHTPKATTTKFQTSHAQRAAA